VGEACGEDDACDGAGACVECVDNATSELDSGCLEGVGVCDADATEGPVCVICEDDQEPGVVDFGCAEGAPACLAGDGVAECVECLEDADCAEGTRCDLDNNSCVVCLDDAEAGSTDFGCAEGSPACLIDEEGAAACVECIANEDCADGSYCDAGSNSCVECLEDNHCDDGNACTTDVCVEFSCGAELDPAGQLCGEGDACDGAGLCVECVDSAEADLDAGCEEGLAVCDADASEGPVCVVCEDSAPAGMSDYGCSDETPACLAEDGAATCVQCLDGADCDSGLCDPVEHVCTSAPEITSGDGEELHSLTIVEGNTEVMTIEAEDADMDELSFSIDGGEDAALFEIDPSTGELSFITAPNVDEPADADEDNVYLVTVKVEDGTGGEDSQTLEITVIDDFFDRDGDGIEDSVEVMNGSDPDDIDSDDDGVIDSDEPDTYEDTDGDGIKNVNDPDSDNDGLFDGTELGVTSASDGTDESAGNFIPDANPESTTDPLNPDTDAGGVSDGDEDTNLNGAIDEGERDPNKALDDIDADDDGFLDDTTLGGTGCDQSDRGGAPWLLLSLLLLLFASRRSVWRGAMLLLAAASLLSVAQPLQAQTPADAQDRVISEPSSFALNRYIPSLTTQGVLNA
jgi:Cys-rich repeat protein